MERPRDARDAQLPSRGGPLGERGPFERLQRSPEESQQGSSTHVNDRSNESAREYVASLGAEELTLLILRDELYDGSWEEMRSDLVGRRDGKPFIFQLATRIDEDLERIARLAAFEEEHNLDLGDYLDEE